MDDSQVADLQALHGSSPVVVISIDGLATRAISTERTPTICSLARDGAGCFTGSTVTPPITLPAHTSMLRSVSPATHGILGNEPRAIDDAAPSFLRAARNAGKSTSAVLSWRPLSEVIEPTATTHRMLIDGGYGLDDDRLVVEAACDQIVRSRPDVIFVYLSGPDLAGHAHGWDDTGYHEAVARADAMLAEIVDAAGGRSSILVTTDHGGSGNNHTTINDDTMGIFVAARSPLIDAGGCWGTFSPLDIAPTVAALAGFERHPDWQGSSLLGVAVRVADRIVALLAELEHHSYGEDVNMLDHSLQTAANLRAGGGDEAAVLAALLHDVGHLMGKSDTFGFSDHSISGARFLQPWFPADVVEPVRLHVEAKRYLVATEPHYASELSAASVETLRQQGGPHSQSEATAFAAHPMAATAVALRRADDAGKVAGSDVPGIEHFRPLIETQLARSGVPPVSAAWARDACRCPECRDEQSGQHLIDATELNGWHVVTQLRTANALRVDLRHDDGRRHLSIIPHDNMPVEMSPTLWGVEHSTYLADRTIDALGSLDQFVSDLAEFGIAVVEGVPPEPGAILDFVGRFGFVRTTNYGELFDVRPTPNATNLAFTSLGLPVHTDNPYRDPVPTLQLLHCLRAARSGGASMFSDGFAAAEQLRQNDPKSFRVLSTTPVTFRFRSPDSDLVATTPLIELDVAGNIKRITVNSRSMEPVGTGSDDFYVAYDRFCDELASPERTIDVFLETGQLVAFDNRRVLHGRGSYAADPTRHLQGCYADIDAVRSAARINRGVTAGQA